VGCFPRITVNLITGFLGVGKTTAIRHLLANHPAAERWAVLVNEFGEVGVDGALLDDTGVTVQEVAGGCLCCVAAPAFTTGLNRIVRRHKPDRILIEPSGLGHPAQVLDTLGGPLYADVLTIGATLCLMDARHLISPRHREHPNFQDQVHVSDVLVANKSDLYSSDDTRRFEAFALDQQPPKQRIGIVANGRVDPAWLDLARSPARRAQFPEAHAFLVETAADVRDDHGVSPDWQIIEGNSDGYHRAGWYVRQNRPWPETALRDVLQDTVGERRKGIFLTEKSWRTMNDDVWAAASEPADQHARLEIIDSGIIDVATVDAALRQLDKL
jgi:G3E family GTPase